MKILSIDVGIYNLAAIIMDTGVHEDTGVESSSCSICYWNDINILSAKEYCSQPKCKRVATHCKDDKNYCIKCKTLLFPNKRLTSIKTALNTRIEDLAGYLYKQIDQSIPLEGVELVLIENQPTRNVKMKNISMLLLGYFAMKGIKVEFVNATKKMKETESIGKSTYSSRKKASKCTVKEMLGDSDWGLFFKCNKKQDDLSDCLLQCLWWIHKNIDASFHL